MNTLDRLYRPNAFLVRLLTEDTINCYVITG